MYDGPKAATSSGRSSVHNARRVHALNRELNSHNPLYRTTVAKTVYAGRVTKGAGCR